MSVGSLEMKSAIFLTVSIFARWKPWALPTSGLDQAVFFFEFSFITLFFRLVATDAYDAG